MSTTKNFKKQLNDINEGTPMFKSINFSEIGDEYYTNTKTSSQKKNETENSDILFFSGFFGKNTKNEDYSTEKKVTSIIFSQFNESEGTKDKPMSIRKSYSNLTFPIPKTKEGNLNNTPSKRNVQSTLQIELQKIEEEKKKIEKIRMMNKKNLSNLLGNQPKKVKFLNEKRMENSKIKYKTNGFNRNNNENVNLNVNIVLSKRSPIGINQKKTEKKEKIEKNDEISELSTSFSKICSITLNENNHNHRFGHNLHKNQEKTIGKPLKINASHSKSPNKYPKTHSIRVHFNEETRNKPINVNLNQTFNKNSSFISKTSKTNQSACDLSNFNSSKTLQKTSRSVFLKKGSIKSDLNLKGKSEKEKVNHIISLDDALKKLDKYKK